MNLDKCGLTSYFKEEAKLYIKQGLYIECNKQEAKKKCKYITKLAKLLKK